MGVKSLWSLLTPVGRPVMLETAEGKVMAIDSSIWIYQFQATMRDKDGRALMNAHVLGFLRRITKLLFFGIKPVFVFDGGAPALKRATLNERRKKKSGAAVSHVKLAEKLLAAQLRREAVKQASKGKERAKDPAALDDPNTVYLEDIDSSITKTPARRKPPTPTSSSKKKGKFHDHDPYKLPDVDLEMVVSNITQSSAPDPRLATEEELRQFIEEMRPEDFDVNSPAFRELPTEVKYEIIGDLRLKSRQTSFARLQKMLKNSRTPLDFSKQQIQNLKQRNILTQQLLVTTDTISSAHISIPVRIASERNREYMLIKNDDGSGGWILGIRDPTGSRDKPIEIDQDPKESESEDEDEDADMEEVEVAPMNIIDPDLRDYQRENTLSALAKRNTDKGLAPISRPIIRKRKPNALFEMNDSDLSEEELLQMAVDDEEEDDESLAFAIQASLDQAKETHVRPEPVASSSTVTLDYAPRTPDLPGGTRPLPISDDEDDMYATPSRLSTALKFAYSSHSGRKVSDLSTSSKFGRPSLLMSKSQATQIDSESDEDMEPVEISVPSPPIPDAELRDKNEAPEMSDDGVTSNKETAMLSAPKPSVNLPVAEATPVSMSLQPTSLLAPTAQGTLSIPETMQSPAVDESSSPPSAPVVLEDSDSEMEEIHVKIAPAIKPNALLGASSSEFENTATLEEVIDPISNLLSPTPSTPKAESTITTTDPLFIPSSRSPSPPPSARPESPAHEEQDFDAAAEMDPHAEEGEFARFLSQVKGRDLHQVRKEIDEEITVLNQQRKAAMRDAEDVSQQMISQIMTMLRLFGIPYITAPMEAEAQCAELVTLGLVDGVITDDSDVFLFGAARVFKNMFNQSKTVECFLSSDLERELGLDRDTLVQLAYLLGSDYTEGLPGVGPVVAMELLKEFPGKDGLWKFKEWWTKVQSGKDSERESGTKFRRMFKKKFKNLYLSADWPNTLVRDAYYHPAVDSSDEPFKWGLPDLDGLRGFFREELSWSQSKVDELLLPIIQKMNKRSQANALNRQGNLNDFLDVSGSSGTMAPRQRQAYASKRLQQVVSDFRKRRQRSANGSREQSVQGDEEDQILQDEPARKKRRAGSAAASTSAKGKGKGKPRAKAAANPAEDDGTGPERSKPKRTKSATGMRKAQRKAKDQDESSESGGSSFHENEDGSVNIDVPLKVELRPRPKPRPRAKKVSAPETTYSTDQPVDEQ